MYCGEYQELAEKFLLRDMTLDEFDNTIKKLITHYMEDDHVESRDDE